MSRRNREELMSSTVVPKSVLQLFEMLNDIDERPYDFVGKLDIPGAEHLGALSDKARKLHAAHMMAELQLAEARRAYESAKTYRDTVKDLFSQAVKEQFPAVVSVEQSPGGAEAKIQNGIFFGAGWAVFRTEPEVLKQAEQAELRRRHRERGDSSDGMPRRPEGLLGALLEGLHLG